MTENKQMGPDGPKLSRPKAIASGALFDGRMDCYILNDGRRVVSQRGEVAALTRLTSGSKHGDLDRFLSRLPNEYKHLASGSKVEFEVPLEGGGARVALGREACDVVDHLRAYADSLVAGKLRKNQEALYLGNGNAPALTPWMVEALTEAAFRMEGGEDFATYAKDCGEAHLQRVVEGAFALAGVPLGFIERHERAILVTYRTLRALGFA